MDDIGTIDQFEHVAQVVVGDEKADAAGLERQYGSPDVGDRKRIEQAVRAEAPKSFLDLNLDALAEGYSIAAAPVAAAVP